MKRLATILITLVLVSSLGLSQTQAQEAKDFKFTIKTNPLSALGGPFWVVIVPVTGEYRVLFEARTLPKQSVEIGLGYVGPSALVNLSKLGDSLTSIGVGGFRGQLMYKFYITSEKAPKGFYVAPYVSYAEAKIKNKKNTSDYIKATKLNVAAVLGYQVISQGGFALDVFTGLGFKDKKWEFSSESGTTSFNMSDLTGKAGVSVTFGFNFGYAF